MKTNYKGHDILDTEKQEYQNWLLKVNLLNTRQAYFEMITNLYFWLLGSDYAIVRQIQTYCVLQDTIEWDYVSVEDLREFLQDELNELEDAE